MARIRVDIAGRRYGKLVAVRDIGSKRGRRLWLCSCDCGETYTSTVHELNQGKTNSCGCLHNLDNPKVKAGRLRCRKPYGVASFNELYSGYRHSAKVRGRAFELTKSQFKVLTKQNCAYCGSEPLNRHHKKNTHGPYICNGVDRVDNSTGYTKDNCVPCCKFCNRAKSIGTVKEFVLWLERIKTLGR